MIDGLTENNRYDRDHKRFQDFPRGFRDAVWIAPELTAQMRPAEGENKNQENKGCQRAGKRTHYTARRAIGGLLLRLGKNLHHPGDSGNADQRIDNLFQQLGNGGRNHRIFSLKKAAEDPQARHNQDRGGDNAKRLCQSIPGVKFL